MLIKSFQMGKNKWLAEMMLKLAVFAMVLREAIGN